MLCFFLFVSSLHDASGQRVRTLQDSCAALRKAYALLNQHPSSAVEQQFVQAFPNTFSSFTNIFGYKGRYSSTSKIVLGCLYSNSMEYIDQLFVLKHVGHEVLYKKIIQLARRSYWQSDGMAIFQSRCLEILEKEPAFLAFLNSQPQSTISSFTRFILLNPIQDNPLKKHIQTMYAKYYNLRKAI